MIKNNDLEIASGNIYKTFFKFSLPNMVGIMAMSSVALVDAYFVSQYVSPVAFAAVNIIMPLITIVRYCYYVYYWGCCSCRDISW